MKRETATAATTAALIATIVLLGSTTAGAADRFTVEPVEIEDTKAVFATVATADTTAARSRIGGTLTELAVDEGVEVRRGQIIARVEDSKLTLRLKAVVARMSSLNAQRKLAATELERTRTLRRKGAASQAMLDKAETALSVLERDVAAMTAERAVIAEERAQGAVRAPTDGRVLAVPVTAGKVVLPGETIAIIAAEGYVLRLQLPERHARFMRVGDEVLIGGRGMLDADVSSAGGTTSRVRQVYPEIKNGRVIADVDVPGLGDYFIGERVRVEITTGKRSAFVVPAEFLTRRFGLTFAVIDGAGETVVQPGRATAAGIEILSGLRVGDVLLAPQSRAE